MTQNVHLDVKIFGGGGGAHKDENHYGSEAGGWMQPRLHGQKKTPQEPRVSLPLARSAV